jgi:hypothetical protein
MDIGPRLDLTTLSDKELDSLYAEFIPEIHEVRIFGPFYRPNIDLLKACGIFVEEMPNFFEALKAEMFERHILRESDTTSPQEVL